MLIVPSTLWALIRSTCVGTLWQLSSYPGTSFDARVRARKMRRILQSWPQLAVGFAYLLKQPIYCDKQGNN